MNSREGETDLSSEYPMKCGSKAPEINAVRIRQSQTNFRGGVVWGAPAVVEGAHKMGVSGIWVERGEVVMRRGSQGRPIFVVAFWEPVRDTEVGENNPIVAVEEYIGRLNVAMDDTLAVKEMDSKKLFRRY